MVDQFEGYGFNPPYFSAEYYANSTLTFVASGTTQTVTMPIDANFQSSQLIAQCTLTAVTGSGGSWNATIILKKNGNVINEVKYESLQTTAIDLGISALMNIDSSAVAQYYKNDRLSIDVTIGTGAGGSTATFVVTLLARGVYTA